MLINISELLDFASVMCYNCLVTVIADTYINVCNNAR